MSMGSEYWVGEIMPYLRLATRNSEEPKRCYLMPSMRCYYCSLIPSVQLYPVAMSSITRTDILTRTLMPVDTTTRERPSLMPKTEV